MADLPNGSPAAEEAVDERKKQNRRPRRRSRRSPEVEAPADSDHSRCSGVDSRTLEKASEVGFASLPSMPARAAAEGWRGCEEAPSSSSSAIGGGKAYDSLALLGSPLEERNPKKSYEYRIPRYFDPHWSEDAINGAIDGGRAFKAVLRVNAYNRQEAYCTLTGVPVDILIYGSAPQNRAVEGDVVAIMLNHVSSWMRLKGSSTSDANEVMDGTLKDVTYGESCSKDLVSDSGSESLSNDLAVEESERSMKRICSLISSFPSKRPTGRVLSIIEPSKRREAVVGFLSVKDRFEDKSVNSALTLDWKIVHLVPTDKRFPEMVIDRGSLPDYLKEKLARKDMTIENELLAARIAHWDEGNFLPLGQVMHIFGHGGEIKPQIGAILFENAIPFVDFSSESLSSLPTLPWTIPDEEFHKRKDFRELCTFTIDPSTAADLDDALSFEKVKDGVYRVGVHIADVSYFVQPDTSLDTEAQVRSTSVYILQHKLPMLPSLLSSNLVSLLPFEDKLTLSIMWEVDLSGNILSHWIGRSIIRSCCKLSYEEAQRVINGQDSATSSPPSDGQHSWKEISIAIKTLHQISEKLKEKRLEKGAILLELPKIDVLFDEYGNPYDSIVRQQTDSNFLVREFMLLANNTAAKMISRAFPESALLRRHPEPNLRKLKEFKAFCSNHGFEVDTSSSGHFHLSLERIRERLKGDPIMFEILLSYALRPMQLAAYFSTGDLQNKEQDWAHYGLGVPQYTHFTSPLRRYPDIIVHRMLLAVIEAEDFCTRKGIRVELIDGFTESKEFKDVLASMAEKYRVPCARELSEIATYCNERKLASKQAEEAGKKVYVWASLKRKEAVVSEARVIRLGPKFMSIYVQKLAAERRISYADVEGLEVEWLENTSTLVLHLLTSKRAQRKPNALKEVALITDPSGSTEFDPKADERVLPAVLPLTLQPLSRIPVVLHATGGDGKCPEIGVRLYLSSYLRI